MNKNFKSESTVHNNHVYQTWYAFHTILTVNKLNLKKSLCKRNTVRGDISIFPSPKQTTSHTGVSVSQTVHHP